MKKLISLIMTLVVVLALILYVPYYFHKCDTCDKLVIGPGYEANLVVDLFSEENQVICRDCAETHHGLTTLFGKDVSDFQRPWFVDPVTMFNHRFNLD